MNGYEEYREAARAGIHEADCEAVLAEDLTARSVSSRPPCSARVSA